MTFFVTGGIFVVIAAGILIGSLIASCISCKEKSNQKKGLDARLEKYL